MENPAHVQHPVFSLSTNHRYWCFRVWSGPAEGDHAREAAAHPPVWPTMNYTSKGKTILGQPDESAEEAALGEEIPTEA